MEIHLASSYAKLEHFHNALDYARERLGQSELSLMEAQYEALNNIVCYSKDAVFSLPIGFRNQMLPFLDLTRVSHCRPLVKGTKTLGTRSCVTCCHTIIQTFRHEDKLRSYGDKNKTAISFLIRKALILVHSANKMM